MIASVEENAIWTFKDPDKQRCADFLRQSPAATWDDFRVNGHRAFQVPKYKFLEVHRHLQLKNAIPLIEGGAAYSILEKRIRAEIEAENRTPTAPAPHKPSTPMKDDADDGVVFQAPLNYPNTPQLEHVKEPMAKEVGIRDLTVEQRDKLILAIRANPTLDWQECYKACGTAIEKSSFQSFRFSTNSKKTYLSTEGYAGPRNGARAIKSSTRSQQATQAPVSLGVNAVLNPNTQILTPQIIGEDIPCDGMKPEEIVALQKYLPTALTLLLGRKMKFKVGRIIDLSDEGNDVPSLQVRRMPIV
jgi:hypothetical protein